MKELEFWIAGYALNALWQIPAVFAAAWMAAWLARLMGPRLEHRLWVGALVAEVVLPMCNFQTGNPLGRVWDELRALIRWSFGGSSTSGETHVILGPVTASGAGLLRLPAWLLAAIGIAYACALVYFTGRLAWGLWKTNRMLREASSSSLANTLAGKLDRYDELAGRDSVHIAISPMVSGPVTIGILRRVLLLPPGFLETVSEADLNAVLAHEFAHMRRRDFAKNLFYGFLSLPVAFHPLVWLTCSRLAGAREMVCDEMAAETVAGKERYARSLLRLASMLTDQMPVRTLHAIGIFDANIFERRIMNLAQKRMEVTRTRRFWIAASCMVVALATCVSAIALRMDVSQEQAQSEQPNPKKIHVKADSLKIVSQVHPVYPPEAKKAGIEGSVLLDVLIGKEGEPEHISVQKGPSELQQSALDAVRQWRWEPYLLNGEPIEVETTVTVVYSLGK